jgi:hypothetical protein
LNTIPEQENALSSLIVLNKAKNFETQPDIELRDVSNKMQTIGDNITSEMGWRTEENNDESILSSLNKKDESF